MFLLIRRIRAEVSSRIRGKFRGAFLFLALTFRGISISKLPSQRRNALVARGHLLGRLLVGDPFKNVFGFELT